MTQIRAATQDDFGALVNLHAIVQNWHAKAYPERFKPNPDAEAMRVLFAGLLEAKDVEIFLAHTDDGPAGYIFARVMRRPETPYTYARDRMHVEHLCVHPDRRREGMGAALLQQVETAARAQGCQEMTLDTWTANHAAQALFVASGMVSLRKWCAKRLAP